MKLALRLFLLALAAYSAVLLAVEWSTSQDYVRHYFSDIEDGRPFFAVNTTLSTFLLLSSALLLVFGALSGRKESAKGAHLFAWCQSGMFAFLAFDDRFQLHEALAYKIGIADHFIMMGWAIVQVAILALLARPASIPVRSAGYFIAGVVLFAVMMVFDALMPHDMEMRLSLEDLTKAWATAMFFFSAWFFARFQIGLDPDEKTLGQFLRWIVTGERTWAMPAPRTAKADR
ncbi:hypothetical protein NAP1_01840 [Erythrobacter sp. NAP1]|uniref:hypothetical protein n=1 Tax=Erythrobacter sp. NAP1 TaxID=237727 RepID=UPI0000686AD9|nr:hypothetical protein [Erythrobacter sp. NAP1]EAQ29474.1 hypothetical protein NAP1_01840 [Erythrobacter sp. NAP1]